MAPPFRLQSILGYRASIVDTLEFALAQLLGAERDFLSKITALQSAQQVLLASLEACQVGVLDLIRIDQLQQRWQDLKQEIVELTEHLLKLQEAIERKRAELISAMQARDVLAKLKERDATAWHEALAQYEAAELDDIYITQAFHKAQQ